MVGRFQGSESEIVVAVAGGGDVVRTAVTALEIPIAL